MRIKFLFVFIILIAVILRFWQLGVNPPSLTWDEAAWGYNAYSLGIDGRDEFGRFLPHDYLESFGDFKPPMYAYLAIVPVKLFGLTEFATRFPSALFGIFAVIITYFLIKEIFPISKNKELYALCGSFILAISPWHIMLSRAAFEANVATTFLITGVWLFLKGVNGKKWSFIFAAVSFVASLYTFNTARVVAPLLVCILSICFWKKLWQQKTVVGFAVVIGVLCLLPTLKFLLSPQAKLRFQEVNIFTDVSVVKTANQEIANDHGAWWSKIIHNRRIGYSMSFLHHYFDNLTPSFLFIKGDGNPKFSTQDVGELYIWDLPFFFTGILFLFKRREGHWFVIPLWLLLGIIPAATARETPHALRIEATLPTFQIFVAYGIVELGRYMYTKLRSNISILLSLGILLLLLCNVGYFLHGYYFHYPREYSGEWQYGYKDSIAYVWQNKAKYDQVDVTTALGRPYIYYLFYTKTSPQVFRQTAIIHRDSFGFVDVTGFGKYRFKDSLNDQGISLQKVLYIAIPNTVPGNVKKLQSFLLLNGQPALVAYTL